MEIEGPLDEAPWNPGKPFGCAINKYEKVRRDKATVDS